jgi:hypothetical protein
MMDFLLSGQIKGLMRSLILYNIESFKSNLLIDSHAFSNAMKTFIYEKVRIKSMEALVKKNNGESLIVKAKDQDELNVIQQFQLIYKKDFDSMI